MLLSDFPQEIIDILTDLLFYKDKLSCRLVCKSWNNIFQNSLYSDLVIRSRETFNSVLTSSLDNRPNYQENGHLVRHLFIRHFMRLTDEDICALQKMFPNVKHICLDNMYISENSLGLDVGWHPWRLLRELSISFWSICTPDIEDKLVKLLLSLPALRLLEMTIQSMFIDSLSFSLDDIETIHSHIKHLEHLKLKSRLLPISDIAFAKIADVSPATAMRSLIIESENTDNRWLSYFAHKYPNLRTIEFCTSGAMANPEKQRDSTMAILIKDPLIFQHLTNMNIQYIDHDIVYDTPIMDIHISRNMTTNRVKISINQSIVYSLGNRCDFPKHITEACLTKYSMTIESFHLSCESMYPVPIQLIDMENTLCNLVDLVIKSSVSVELDTFLCTAPRLKTIALRYADIKVKDELYTSKRFGLQSFKVNDAKITSDVLRFLSFHCRNLNELELIRSLVYGNITTPGCQFIDMSYSRLQRLFINSAEFIIQENECRENLNITLITRPVKNIPPKQDYDPNVLPTVIKKPTKAHHHWFHLSKPQTKYSIPKERDSGIMRFTSNYETSKSVTLERDRIKAKNASKRWKDKCIFGYTKIKLGYIADYRVANHYYLFKCTWFTLKEVYSM